MEKLLRPLNLVLGQVRTGLANGLSINDNLNAEVRTIDVSVPSQWVAFTLTAPYTAGSVAPAYRKIGRRVQLRGILMLNAAASGSTWATLPGAAKPEVFGAFAIPGGAAGEFLRASVNTASAAILTWTGTPTACSLDGMAYDAADETGATTLLPGPSVKTRVTAVSGVLLLRALRMSGRDLYSVTGLGAVGWEQDGSAVKIRSVTGLAGGSTYRLTLAILGG